MLILTETRPRPREKDMSFKFRLGEIVVPSKDATYDLDIPRGPSEVTAIQLRGYIQITPVGTTRRLLVKADDYERFQEEAGKSTY